MSNLMHKVKDVVTGHHDKNENHNTHDFKASQKVDGSLFHTPTAEHGANNSMHRCPPYLRILSQYH